MRIAALVPLLVIVLTIAAAAWYALIGFGVTSKIPVATSTATVLTSTVPVGPSYVSLALLDTSGTTTGKQRGCDRVVLTPFSVATTTTPLTDALKLLFGLNTTSVRGLFNFIDRTNETLALDRAAIVNGTAHIYLIGSVSGLAGACDEPRTQIQIEETALQFLDVKNVRIFLNGATTTSLTPSQQ